MLGGISCVYVFAFLSKLGDVMITTGIDIEFDFPEFEEFGAALAWWGAKLHHFADWMLLQLLK